MNDKNIRKRFLVSSFISFFTVFVLLQLDFWQMLDRKSFDISTTLFTPKSIESDIIIVGIDESSFVELDAPWPWPRAWHGKLLNRLTKAGAKVVVFDLIFDTPSSFGDLDDMNFAEAIMQQPNTILGRYQQHQLLAEGYQITSVEPIELYQEAGAKMGNVSIHPDADGVIRLFPYAEQPIWQQVLSSTAQLPKNSAFYQDPTQLKLIHFLGEANSFPFVSYYRALEEALLPDSIFKDKIVLIGLDILAPAELGLNSDDRYMSPFSFSSEQYMSGIEFHANLIENARQDLAISPLSTPLFIITLLVLILLSALLFIRWHALKTSLLFIGIISGLTAFHWLLFTMQIFVPLFSLLVCVGLTYLSQGIFAYHQEQKDRKFITKAFSHYVSPQVLDELMLKPEQLSLGGKRKMVTIMFTDIQGFTEISEQLSAEQVADLLQQHLSAMSAIIVKHGGTLDKYIGDAIMAFWGAPLLDEKQADNAVNAAKEMQEACEDINHTFKAQNLPEVTMRIGVHSGEAIVGNMGSDSLFDYTCIGDAVNLAARLEGINKFYQTDILFSENTKAQLTENSELQFIDHVCVKGKQQAIKIFTASHSRDVSSEVSSEISALLDKGYSAYQNQNWDNATQYYQQVLAIDANQKVADLFLARISEFEKSTLDTNWNGVYIFDSK